jgi:hypothetical protein
VRTAQGATYVIPLKHELFVLLDLGEGRKMVKWSERVVC